MKEKNIPKKFIKQSVSVYVYQLFVLMQQLNVSEFLLLHFKVCCKSPDSD